MIIKYRHHELKQDLDLGHKEVDLEHFDEQMMDADEEMMMQNLQNLNLLDHQMRNKTKIKTPKGEIPQRLKSYITQN